MGHSWCANHVPQWTQKSLLAHLSYFCSSYFFMSQPIYTYCEMKLYIYAYNYVTKIMLHWKQKKKGQKAVWLWHFSVTTKYTRMLLYRCSSNYSRVVPWLTYGKLKHLKLKKIAEHCSLATWHTRVSAVSPVLHGGYHCTWTLTSITSNDCNTS